MTQCLHSPLEEHELPWLDATKDAGILKDLASVVLDKQLLKKVEYYLNFRYLYVIMTYKYVGL